MHFCFHFLFGFLSLGNHHYLQYLHLSSLSKHFHCLCSLAFIRFLPILLTCQEFRTEPYVQSTGLNLFLSRSPLLRISLLNYYSPKDCTKNYYVTKFTNQRFIQTRIVNIAFGVLNLICLLLSLFLIRMLVILDSIHQDFSFL